MSTKHDDCHTTCELIYIVIYSPVTMLYLYVCDSRWENLVRKYKDIRNPPTGSSTEKGVPTQWTYFNTLHDFMASRHTIHPPLLIDTSHTPTATDMLTPDIQEPTTSRWPCSAGSSTPTGSIVCGSKGRKRKASQISDVLNYFKEEEKREEERHKEMVCLFKEVIAVMKNTTS